ncbi:MAG: outer membrane lipoprotein-sorting protein [Ignavibacterium sp.]
MQTVKYNSKFFLAFIFTGLLLLQTNTTAQELSALDILKKFEVVINAPKDQQMNGKLILIDSKGNEKERTITMLQKGDDNRLVRFLSLADQKGIGFLGLPDDVQYLYLPAFKKVRSIASHIKNQKFAGTDFTYDDLGTLKYSDDYNPKLVETTKDEYVLERTPKAGKDKDYSKLKIWVRKDIMFPVKTEFYDKANRLWKTMERRLVEKIDVYWISKEIEMKDLKDQHSSKMQLSEIILDSNLSDNLFTERNLEKF